MIDLEKARSDYEHILLGREGRWFDPGEYEDLKQRWFDTYALGLVESLEAHNERAMEQDEHDERV